MSKRFLVAVLVLISTARLPRAAAQTAPPAPVLVAPANGASAVQPITLQWAPIVDPDGPIGSYTWEVSTSSAFASVILSGFTNNLRPDIPTSTEAQVSGLANGTYFWRVKGSQNIGGATGFIDSPFSAPRSFTVTGLGPAPAGVPTITSPAFGASFHPVEFFDIVWTEVTGAQYYLLEADDDAGFSYPITLSGGPTIVFGTKFHAGWGNEIPNIHYRVRAVSADNVWGRPSATLTVHIANAAPIPPPPTPLFPSGGATVSLPFTFDWTDTANPQIPGYDIDIDDEPNFLGTIGVLMVTQISRSDYMLAPDPGQNINLPPGTYFWRVRALHGDAFGPWSAGTSFTITASPPEPPDPKLFWILTDPGNAHGGNSTAARIALTAPAPPGGALVHVASDVPGVEVPPTVVVPAGTTDALVSPVTTVPAQEQGIVGTLRAAYGGTVEQNSIGILPTLWGGALSAEAVIGGTPVTGTVTLLEPAPRGGINITLISDNTSLARPPANLFIPASATSATYQITTSPVAQPTRVVFSFGSPLEDNRAPDSWLLLLPAGSPAPAAALSALTLNPPTVLGGATRTGTLTLTAPAPAGGAQIRVNGSADGTMIVTVPAGTMTVDFPIRTLPVARPNWVLIQATYGFDGAMHATTLEIDPGPPGPSPLFAMGASPLDLIGGATSRGTVGLSVPAPPGGAVVTLTSSDTSLAQVPASVTVAPGNSTASFMITTSPVDLFTTASVTATADGASRTVFLNLAADPNAGLLLLSITPSVGGAIGGNSINATLFLNKAAPAGGAIVTLSTNNAAAARVPPIVTVPAGLGFASFNITTFPVTADTAVTITGTLGATRTATITVLASPLSISSVSLNPATVVGGSPSTGTATLTAAAPAGGTVVTLSSNNMGVATVPASVTVAAGATSATFQVTTKAVANSTSVTITGSAGGVSRTATLTVTPNLAGFRGPTANAADTGGDGNGFETGAVNAQTDDNLNAVDTNSGTNSSLSCTSPGRDNHRFFNYGLGVPPGVGVLGIEVRVDARVDSTGGTPKMCVQLSWDGGTTWTASQSTPTLTTTMASYVLGSPVDTWGRTWASSDLSDANFRVRVTNVANSTARDFSLDWIAVRVTTGVNNGSPPALDLTLSGVPSSVRRGLSFTATGTVANTGATAGSGYTVLIGFNPADSARLQGPQRSTQSVPAVPAGGTQAVSWQIRADRAGPATLTMTLQNSSGVTVGTASQAFTILN
ncbi:MAG TPA: hypothetical protein VE422_25245 [Terriglobia bacterium]|nr:hypothetical protein [Terriglobia bacterium]